MNSYIIIQVICFVTNFICLMIGIAAGIWIVDQNGKKNALDPNPVHTEEQIGKIAVETGIKSIEYSNEMLKFIREFTVDYVTVEFEVYRNNIYSTNKVTKEALKNFINQCATGVHNTLPNYRVKSQYLLYTDEYIESYIINVTAMTVRKLFEKAVDTDTEIEL